MEKVDKNLENQENPQKSPQEAKKNEEKNDNQKQSNKKPVSKPKWFLAGLIVGIVVIIILMQIGVLASLGLNKSNAEITSMIVQEKIVAISELATASYTYTNADTRTDSKRFFGSKIPIPFTGNRFIVKYDGKIKAGFNTDEIDVDIKGNKVHVQLPDPVILSNEIGKKEFLDESNNILNPIQPNEVTAYFERQEKLMEKKAIERGLLDEAKSNAIVSISEMLEGFLPEEYKVVVE